MDAWDGGPRFRDALESSADVTSRLTAEQIDRLFDPAEQLRHVDAVFARLGLLSPVMENHRSAEAVLA
jgi:adenylosuccinate lyase